MVLGHAADLLLNLQPQRCFVLHSAICSSDRWRVCSLVPSSVNPLTLPAECELMELLEKEPLSPILRRPSWVARALQLHLTARCCLQRTCCRRHTRPLLSLWVAISCH